MRTIPCPLLRWSKLRYFLFLIPFLQTRFILSAGGLAGRRLTKNAIDEADEVGLVPQPAAVHVGDIELGALERIDEGNEVPAERTRLSKDFPAPAEKPVALTEDLSTDMRSTTV